MLTFSVACLLVAVGLMAERLALGTLKRARLLVSLSVMYRRPALPGCRRWRVLQQVRTGLMPTLA